ncbi:MAG: alpha/beta hydrolase [Chloracidobacterium sp.]|nr:alpha/beta hydrolase [Chloracidobacterium sp.]
MNNRANLLPAFFLFFFWSAAFGQEAAKCFGDREVSFASKARDISIAGTLSVPNGKGPFPTVLMITGNGPHTRDQIISNSPMFKMIGDHFARRGFVVLRTDARGYGKSSGPNDWEKYTTADRVEDNQAALAFLGQQKEVDKKRIILFGHSEGALIAAAIAAKDNVALSILLAPSTLKGDEVVARQLEGNLLRRGADPKNAEAVRKAFIEFARFAVAGGSEGEEFDRLALNFLEAHGVAKEKLDLKLARGLIGGYLTAPWYKYFFAYDPAKDLSAMRSPAIAIFAGEDTNVPLPLHKPRLEKTIWNGKGSMYSIFVIPDQDHFFLEFEGKRQEKHTPGKMQVAEELFSTLDVELERRGLGRSVCDENTKH